MNTYKAVKSVIIHIFIFHNAYSCAVHHSHGCVFTRKATNTIIAEFENTVDPDEKAHNKLSHLDLQCLPSSL